VPYQHILKILEREKSSDFQSVYQGWRPKDLLFLRQVTVLLQDMAYRLESLDQAKRELRQLGENSGRYMLYIQRLKLHLRACNFAWRSNQVTFLVSAADFYRDYGAVLRLLRIDQLRGKF